MICRYYLKIGATEIGDDLDGCIDCTEMVCNSEDIEVAYKRTSIMGGVVRQCTSSIVFCDSAKELLYKEYLDNYLAAKAAFAVYTINNDWTYKKEYECPLDFSSMKYDSYTVEFNCVDMSVAAIIKANKSVKYEFPVSELAEKKSLLYDRLEIKETADYLIVSDDNESSTKNIDLGYNKCYLVSGEVPPCYRHIFLPIYISNVEQVFDYLTFYDEQKYGCDTNSAWGVWKEHSDLSSEGEGPIEHSEVKYLLKAEKPTAIKFGFKMKGTINTGLASSGAGYYNTFSYVKPLRINVVCGRYTDENYVMESVFSSSPIYLDKKNQETFSINRNLEIVLGKNDIVAVVVTVPYMQCNEDIAYGKAMFLNINLAEDSISVSHITRGDDVYVNVIKPQVLLNSILSKFNIVGRFDYNGYYSRLENTVIVASESIRGIDGAKIYTSFSDFCKWMEAVFGFIYEIDEREVVFKHRGSLFSDDVVLDLTGHVNDLSVNLDTSNIYSVVRAGYKKQEYDSINGRDEFHFTNEYTTGVDLTDNKFELVSPYRADAYGFEFLCQKRNEKTTDDKSDEDIFFVEVNEEESCYSLYRTFITGVLSPKTMFNQNFASSQCIRENRGLIGMFAKKLFFASSEGNSDVVVNYIPENSDIEMIFSLATVAKLNVSSDVLDLPKGAFTGLLCFCLNGYKYKFYIDSVDLKYQREQKATYDGIIKSIERL